MKILLLGANGRTGREILQRALLEGDTVTAVVRAEDRLSDVRHERVLVRVGNPCDPDALEPLLPGHDVVVSVLGPRWPSKAAASIYPDSAAAIVEAMQRSDVERLLVTSSGLLFPEPGFWAGLLRCVVSSIVDGARRMEERIRTSGLDWTIARTSFLTNDSALRYRSAADTLPEGGGAVSRAAVARFLLQEAAQADHRQQVVGLCG